MDVVDPVEEEPLELTIITDARDNPTNPFATAALRYEITRPVNVSQLQDEIIEALGVTEVMVSSQATHDPNVRVLWVAPALDEEQVRELIGAHEIDPQWGFPRREEGLDQAVERLRDGLTLSNKEISIVLRAMAR